MPKGGYRPGAGRKPKSPFLRSIDGNAGRRPVPELGPAEEFEPPETLSPEGRQVWMRLAPHAFKARTLNPGTALAFEFLCENIVLEKRFRQSVKDCGSNSHQTLEKAIKSDLDAYSLRPRGKPMYQAAPVEATPSNPLQRFIQTGA